MEIKSDSSIERKKLDTQNKIVIAAVALFHRDGLEAVTMEQIAEAADIAKGTLYNYYPSKDAIINAFIQSSFRQRNPDRVKHLRQLPDTRSRMTAVFGILIKGVQAQKEIFETFWVYRMKQIISFRPVEAEQSSGLGDLIQAIISLGQQTGELRSDLPEDILQGLFEFAFIEAVKPLYLTPEHFNADESIARCVDLFLNGAKA